VNWGEVCGVRGDIDSAKPIHLVVDVLGWFLCGPSVYQPKVRKVRSTNRGGYLKEILRSEAFVSL